MYDLHNSLRTLKTANTPLLPQIKNSINIQSAPAPPHPQSRCSYHLINTKTVAGISSNEHQTENKGSDVAMGIFKHSDKKTSSASAEQQLQWVWSVCVDFRDSLIFIDQKIGIKNKINEE